MNHKNALIYALGSQVYDEAEKCHAPLLETLREKAEKELKHRYPCVLVDANGGNATAPPMTLKPEEQDSWTEAVGLFTAALFLRSGDGRQMFTLIKKRVEKEVKAGSESTEETFKPVDTVQMANDAENEAIGAMQLITCVGERPTKAARRPSLSAKAGKNRAGSCAC